MKSNNWLHLFTSNIRELYISDAIDVLAAPKEHVFRFRYQYSYVSENIEKAWRTNELRGTPVIVYFSLQHTLAFYEAAYFPLRTGEVVRTWREGSTLLVDFKIGDYLVLPHSNDSKARANEVRQFTVALKNLLNGAHPDSRNTDRDRSQDAVSATVAGHPKELIGATGNSSQQFEAAVDYLVDALGSEPQRSFFRVCTLKDRHGNDVIRDKAGILELVGGQRYTMEVAHHQPRSLTGQVSIEFDSPSAIDIVGQTKRPLRSRYDVFTVPLFAPFRDDEAQGELSVNISAPDLGATVRMPFRIKPSRAHRLLGPVLGIVGAVAIAIPGLLAKHVDLRLTVGIAIVGAVIVSTAIAMRRSRGLG